MFLYTGLYSVQGVSVKKNNKNINSVKCIARKGGDGISIDWLTNRNQRFDEKRSRMQSNIHIHNIVIEFRTLSRNIPPSSILDVKLEQN